MLTSFPDSLEDRNKAVQVESGGRVVSYANQIGQIIATTKWVGVRSVQVNREQGLTTNNKFKVEQADVRTSRPIAIKAGGAVSCLLEVAVASAGRIVAKVVEWKEARYQEPQHEPQNQTVKVLEARHVDHNGTKTKDRDPRRMGVLDSVLW